MRLIWGIQDRMYEDSIWINPTTLVPKPSGKVRLVIYIRKVNKLKMR
jgi:hypothetical protein